MNTNYYKEFLVLASKKNFLEASADLYIAQSALSKHIQKMEKDLKVPLFIRNTKNVQLSEYGELLLPYAQKIVESEEGFEQELREQLHKKEHSLEIGSISALAQYHITDIISTFRDTHKDLTVNVELGRSSELLKNLKKGKYDLAFIREVEQSNMIDEEFIRIPYTSDSLGIVLPSGHRFANEDMVDLHLLKDENFLFLGMNNMPYHLCRNACLQCGFEPNIVFFHRYPETLIDLVKLGMGVALMPKPLADYCNFPEQPEIRVLEVIPVIKSYLNFFYVKNRPLSPLAKDFINLAKEYSAYLYHS